jgi:hypothetical protein
MHTPPQCQSRLMCSESSFGFWRVFCCSREFSLIVSLLSPSFLEIYGMPTRSVQYGTVHVLPGRTAGSLNVRYLYSLVSK